jgi:hypothetical protein
VAVAKRSNTPLKDLHDQINFIINTQKSASPAKKKADLTPEVNVCDDFVECCDVHLTVHFTPARPYCPSQDQWYTFSIAFIHVKAHIPVEQAQNTIFDHQKLIV